MSTQWNERERERVTHELLRYALLEIRFCASIHWTEFT